MDLFSGKVNIRTDQEPFHHVFISNSNYANR